MLFEARFQASIPHTPVARETRLAAPALFAVDAIHSRAYADLMGRWADEYLMNVVRWYEIRDVPALGEA